MFNHSISAGLRAIHKRIVDCSGLQLDEAVEMVASPFEVDHLRPFGEELAQTTGEKPLRMQIRGPGHQKRQPRGRSTTRGQPIWRTEARPRRNEERRPPPTKVNYLTANQLKNMELKLYHLLFSKCSKILQKTMMF